jgi:hypothetical protein
MLDNPEKTARLVAALKAAVPFEVELAPKLIEHLQDENLANSDLMHLVWDLSAARQSRWVPIQIVALQTGPTQSVFERSGYRFA